MLVYGLAALVVVVLVSFPFVWTWVERRARRKGLVGAGAERPRLRNSRRFQLSYLFVFVCSAGAFVWLDHVASRWHYLETLNPRIHACEETGDRDACLDVALRYRNGVTGRCTEFIGGTKYTLGTRTTVSCTFLDRDQDKANRFAQAACDYGHLDGCFYAANWGWALGAEGVTPAHLRETETLCERGAFRACQFLSDVSRAPLSEPVLPPIELVHQACASGNGSACLHSLKHRALEFVRTERAMANFRELLDLKGDMKQLSVGGTPSHFEHTKLVEIDQVLIDFTEEFRRRAAAREPGALTLDATDVTERLQAIELPVLTASSLSSGG